MYLIPLNRGQLDSIPLRTSVAVVAYRLCCSLRLLVRGRLGLRFVNNFYSVYSIAASRLPPGSLSLIMLTTIDRVPEFCPIQDFNIGSLTRL